MLCKKAVSNSGHLLIKNLHYKYTVLKISLNSFLGTGAAADKPDIFFFFLNFENL